MMITSTGGTFSCREVFDWSMYFSSCVEIVTHTYVDVKSEFADNGVIIISHFSFFIPHYEDLSGGYCSGVPPLPIPNREVKPACADGTAMQCGRVGGRHLYKK